MAAVPVRPAWRSDDEGNLLDRFEYCASGCLTFSLDQVPAEQVVGTTLKTEFEMQNRSPAPERLRQIDVIDDGPGKPENIGKFIGKRPIAAFRNSDGDQQMLEWTAAGSGPKLKLPDLQRI